MPFTYEFKLNGEPLKGVELGFSKSRKWEEALDDAKLSLPFVKSRDPKSMYGLLQVTIREVNNYQQFNVLNQREVEYLIINDEVTPTTKNGYYRHDLNALEYTSKLDAYFVSSLAKSRMVLSNRSAPFETNQELNYPWEPTSDRKQVRINVFMDPIQGIKEQYFSGYKLIFDKVDEALQNVGDATATRDWYQKRKVFIETNAPIPNNFHWLSESGVEWNLPKGKWWIKYGLEVINWHNYNTNVPNGNHPLYTYFIEVIDKQELSVFDLVESVRQNVSKFGGIESEYYFQSTRIFELKQEDIDYLKNIPAPQTFLENATARQMLMFALSYVNSLPRLKWNKDLDILEIEKYNLNRGDFEKENLIEFSGSQNTNQFGSSSYSFLRQTLPNDMNNPTTYSPNSTHLKRVRSSKIQLTNDNFESKLEKPIYMPLKFYTSVSFEVKAQPNLHTFRFDIHDFDLTDRLVNIDEWKLKETGNNFPNVHTQGYWESRTGMREFMTGNIYWELGGTSISLSDVYGEIFQTNLIRNVIREAVYEYVVKNQPFSIDSTGDNEYQIANNYEININEVDIKQLEFRLEYISLEDILIKQDKSDLSQIDFYSEMRHNQDESIINIIRASRKIYGDLQRTGNYNFSFTKKHTTFSDMYEVGQKDVNNYTITSINEIYYNDFILVTYFITKNHNRIQQATHVDQTYRWRDNYTKQVLNRHENYSDFLVITKPNDETVLSQHNKIPSIERTVGRILDIILGRRLNDNDFVNNAFVRTDGYLESYPDRGINMTAVVTPVVASSIKNGFAFTFGFDNNQIVGDSLVQKGNNFYNKAIKYTDNQGRFSRFGFALINDIWGIGLDYPLYELWNINDENNYLFFSTDIMVPGSAGRDALIVDKDPLTNFKLTYQLRVVTNDSQMYVLGQQFFNNNMIIKKGDGTKPYIYFYNDEQRVEIFDDLFVPGGHQTRMELNSTRIQYNDNDQVRFIGEALFALNQTGIKRWAIGTEDGELYIACNGKMNGFNIVSRHWRSEDLYEIGSKIMNRKGDSILFSSISDFYSPQIIAHKILSEDMSFSSEADFFTEIFAHKIMSEIVSLESEVNFTSSIRTNTAIITGVRINGSAIFEAPIQAGKAIIENMVIKNVANFEANMVAQKTLIDDVNVSSEADFVSVIQIQKYIKEDIQIVGQSNFVSVIAIEKTKLENASINGIAIFEAPFIIN